MRVKLFAASLWTLTLLFGMLAAVLFLALYSQGSISVSAVFGLTIIFNVLIWLVSPKLMDWTLRFFYKATFYNSQAEFAAAYPQFADFINKTVQQNKTPFPKVRVINDDNPTAYSFGSGKWNARVVFTQGLITYLEQDELEAVLAHELGHIVHRDFIVMSIANAIIQLLYEIYYVCTRNRGNDRDSGRLALIGWVAYIFYFIGTYIVLYLNRLREYYADEFSAQTLHQGDALSRALIKVAYGIMAREDTASGARLLESTKTMGIMSLQSAKSAGLAMKVTNMQPDKVAKVMLFDVVSPWAKLAELSSTHPLTGKRILRLQKMDVAAGRPAVYDIEAARQGAQIDKNRLWSGFLIGGFMYFLIWIIVIACFVAGVIIGASNPTGGATPIIIPVSFVVILGLLLLRILYKYPAIKDAQNSDIYSLMTDLYAGPVRGRPVKLTGSVIGRGMPGYMFSEDMMMQDNTGLLYLDYQGRIPLFSNLMFALRKLKKLVGQNVTASGWFFRSNTQFLRLKRVDTPEKPFKSYPRLWAVLGSILLALLLSIALGIVATPAKASQSAATSASGVAQNSSLGTQKCYGVKLVAGAKVKNVDDCSMDIAYSAAGSQDFVSLSIVTSPRFDNSFSQEVKSWKNNPLNNGIKITSDSQLTFDGLPSEKVIFSPSALGSSLEEMDWFIDSSSRITSPDPGTKYYTQILGSYSPGAKPVVEQILNNIQIKNTTIRY